MYDTTHCELRFAVRSHGRISTARSLLREWRRSAVDTGLVHGRFSMQPRGNLRQEKMFYVKIIFKFFLSEVNLHL